MISGGSDYDGVSAKPATKSVGEPAIVTQYRVGKEPFYKAVGNEEVVFDAAFSRRLPVLLKGPTGCGKTRFIEYVAWKHQLPLYTVSCHEDLTANDLVGRLIVSGGDTEFIDGPLTLAAKHGGIAYLDEVVEARKDATVVIHSLTDHRRQLALEKIRTVVDAHPDFVLAISYNPGYQSIVKDLKQSTKQRFVGISFDYPSLDVETEIVHGESNVDKRIAKGLARVGAKIRNLKDDGLEEGASTRLLVDAGYLIQAGLDVHTAIKHAVTTPITDDADMVASIDGIVNAIFGAP